MVGRDPDEAHGSATPLELLFDLTLVVAFGVAGEQFAHLANSVMVSGYIVMRVAMVFQWLRAAKHDPTHRPAALTYAVTLVIAQVGWVAVVIAPLTLEQVFAVAAVLMLLELSGPVIAERIKGGTPWHVHHIVERHGLLVIITLGEGVIGTAASLAAVGAGLHVAAYYIEHVAHVGAVATVLTVALPVAVFIGPSTCTTPTSCGYPIRST